MKAIVLDSFGAPDVMRVSDIDKPDPGPDQILIRMRAASVNRPDVIQRLGNYPPPPGESEIPGLECAGIVAATGDKVDTVREGDRVFALVGGGAYAEYVVADAAHSLPVPDSMSFEQAACIAEAYITAWMNIFGNGQLGDGESVLIHGASGGVGTAAVQMVKILRPASPVFATASTAKLDRVAALGADQVFDYSKQDFADEIRRLTDGTGIDVILDHIGGANLESNLNSLAINGRLVVIGLLGGSKANLNLGQLMIKRQRIIGSVLRSRPRDEKAGIIARFAEEIMPHFASGAIVPIIDTVLPLEKVIDAHRLMESGGHFGKIVLVSGH